ncbi:MAG: calcium/sodium antiporter [Pseudomonadota bacterium]
MLQTVLFLLLGLGVLLAAGEAFVRGAASLARILNIPVLIIGLTVVAFGTSAPELWVTIQAVSEGSSGIAMGNIVGSNIANVLLVLGMPAVLAPVVMSVPGLRRHGIALLLATALFCAMVYRSGGVGTFEGAVFALGMLIYFGMMIYEARSGQDDLAAEAAGLTGEKPRLPPTLLLLIAGVIGLPVGATLLVDNGSALAEALGVRDEVIGLTVVAFGTSLPELATVLVAAAKRQAEVVAGSIVGSNIFNMLFVGSAAGLVGESLFTSTALAIDLPVMIGATLLFAGFILARRNISRWLGALMAIGYGAYVMTIGTAGL